MTAVEVGALVTAVAPREGWAPPIEIASAPALKLSSVQMTGQRHAISFEPLAVELKAVQQAQAHAVMVVEGANQAARLRRHLEAYEIDVNIDCKTFPELIERADYRPAIIEGEISAGVVLESDGLYIYSRGRNLRRAARASADQTACEGRRAAQPRGAAARRSRRPSRSRHRAVSRPQAYEGCRHGRRLFKPRVCRQRHHVRAGRAHQPGAALHRRRRQSAAQARQTRQRRMGEGQAPAPRRRCSRWRASCSISTPRAK